MKKNLFKNNKLIKILAWTGLGTLIAGGLAGTTVGIVNFSKDSSSVSKGTNFEDSVETVINVSVDQNKSEEENLAIIQDISNRVIENIESLGVSQIEIKSSIQYLPITINDNPTRTNSAYIQYGSIHIFTEKNIPNFTIDFNSDNYVTRTLSKLSLYYSLSNNFNYNLEAINVSNGGKIIDESGLPDSSKINKNFNEIYQINSNNNIAFRNESSINIPLSKVNNQDWNLDIMQKQFTEVYKWDGTTPREDAMNGSNDESATYSSYYLLNENQFKEGEDSSTDSSDSEETFIKTTPKVTYLYWENRSGFINKLQLLATIAYLYANKNNGGFHENNYNDYPDYKNDPYNFPITTIESLWEEFGGGTDSDEGLFLEYVKGSDYFDIMQQLYDANQFSYGISDTNEDPLLKLLRDFFAFNVNVYKNKGLVDFDPESPKYEFLYSWNAEKITLFNSYLTPIDYNNFFKFFTDNTDSEDTEVIKNSYVSQNFNISKTDSSVSNINSLVNLINNASYTNPILLTELTSPVFELNSSPMEIYNDLISYFNSFVYEYPSYLSNSVTKISSYNGVLIGISVLILIIGIIVSILYRFPGLISLLTSAFSFGLSFIMMMSLNTLFSVSTYIALIVSTICMFIPLINSQIHLRNSIRYNKNNLYNAFLNSIKSFIKTSIVTYIPLIIISLTFLFFGKNQVNEFGSSLIILLFANIISSCVLFLIIYSLSYFLIFKNNPKLVIPRPYINILNKLKVRGAKFSVSSTNSLLDIAINKLFSLNKVKFIIYSTTPIVLLLLGIIGCILFGTIGPSYMGNPYDSSQMVIYYNSSQSGDVQKMLSELTNHFNINWESSKIVSNIYKNGLGNNMYQYTLISKNTLNINEIFAWIKTSPYSALTNNISFVTLNNTIPTLLFNNAIQVMLIATAFISIFSLIYVNFLNFIPILLITIITNLVSIGIIGILRIPVDINTIMIFLGIFIISNIFIFNTYNNILFKFNKKIEYSYKEIFNSCLKQLKHTIKLQTYILLMSIIYGLLLMLFVSTDLIFNQLILFIGTLTSFIITIPLSFIFCVLMLRLREWYITKVRKNKKSHINKVVYDKIDEQIIVGINAH